MQKVTDALFSLKEATASFAPQAFVAKCFLIFIVNEVENFAANIFLSWCVSHILGVVHHWLVTYCDPCKKGGIHILKSSDVLKR